MARSSRAFVRAFQKQQVDIGEVFHLGVKRLGIEEMASRAALALEPDDGLEPGLEPQEEQAPRKQRESGPDPNETRVYRDRESRRQARAEIPETELPTPVSHELDPSSSLGSSTTQTAPPAPAPAADADSTVPLADRETRLEPAVETDLEPALLEAGHVAPSSPDDHDTPLDEPIVSSIAPKRDSGLLAHTHLVPHFVPGPFPAGHRQIAAIASGLTGGLLLEERCSVLVTSLHYGEGKTALAAGIALELARTPGQRVLLLDADLVRPSCAGFLGVQPEAGLLAVLGGETTPAQAIYCSERDRLALLANSGMEGGASDLLGTRAMLDLLATLHEAFDIIVVDTPPLRVAADAFALAPHLGGTLLAVRAQGTSLKELVAARRSLTAARARVIGSVLTYADEG